jgi:hypothetical protein
VTVNGQQAIDALKTNNAFKNVGVALREERPSMDVLARAAERLTDLTGDMVVPLEDEISRISTRLFPQLQHKYAPLAEKLRGLDLPGAEQLSDLNQAIADSLQIDASDAPQRLGAEESTLYDSLKWAGQVKQSLEQGLEQTLRELQRHCREIQSLPSSDIPGQLKTELADELSSLGERIKQTDFFKHAADFNTALTTMQNRTRDAVIAMEKAQQTRAQEVEQDLQRLPEWLELTAEEQGSVFDDLENLALSVSHDTPAGSIALTERLRQGGNHALFPKRCTELPTGL